MSDTQFDNPPTNAPPVEKSPNGTLGHIQIGHSVPDEAITNVTFQFRLSKDRLNNRGISASDVVLYRYHDGEWTALATTVAGQTETGILFRAESPGLSIFAIGTHQPTAEIRVADATLSTTEIMAGEQITVTVVIENQGNDTGEFTVDLFIDDQREDTVQVTVSPGNTQTVTFRPQFETAGEYALRVNDVDAGRLQVTRETSSSSTTTTTTSKGTATPSPSSDTSSIPLTQVGIAGTLLAVIAGGAYVLRTRR
ncbi:PGF-pre-PGF domain-containing protein [Haladaptatus sp. NG-SE-30]